ncbi:MAG TPA: 3-oxoacyl-[acyl-carrier-protein] synthase III C-terminal domain-containing protein [Thermoleophilaceae bacterium]|nr:3-oxoacyl-[acyl-carrier-protein] synthase III C-terminal domain-containing protein [Thermoleophilaceae bacterium]
MKQVRIVSTGSYLPGDPIDNEMMERLAGGVPDDVLEGLQVKTRHWAVDPETGEHRESNSEMAAKAAREALELADIDVDEVDLLVLSTASPEYHLPPASTFVQEKLGRESMAVVDIRSGCAGAVEALDLARLHLERGDYETAVVVGSEAISPLCVPVYLAGGPNKVRMRDRLGIYSFGDGAGAMVLRAFEDGADGILGASAIACVGGNRKPGMQVVGGGTHAPVETQRDAKRLIELKVDVVESGRFTPFVLTEGLKATLERAGVQATDVDHCVIPEGNAAYMTDELREAGLLTDEWLELEPKIFENLGMVGATGSAAVPIALDYGWKSGAIKQDDMVMLLAIETSRWKYGGVAFPWTAGPVPEREGLSQASAPAAG